MDNIEIRALDKKLSAALGESTLTPDELLAAVCLVSTGDSGLSQYSPGTRWFLNNIPALVAYFGQEIYCRFLLDADASAGRHFCETVVANPDVFMSIEDEARRRGIAGGMYLRHGTTDGDWVAAFNRFMECDEVANLLLQRLCLTDASQDTVSSVQYFLEYGDSDLFEVPEWSALNPVELEMAFEICARQAPIGTYNAAQKLYRFLPEDRVTAVRQAVRDRLTVDDLSDHEFLGLSWREREERLCQRQPFKADDNHRLVASYVRKLVGMVVTLSDKEHARALLDRGLQGILVNADTAVVYRNTRTTVDKSHARLSDRRQMVIDAIGAWLDQRDDAFLGTVVEGQHRGVSQMQVRERGDLYVHVRQPHRYTPKAGDQVLVRLSASRRLAPGVYRVAFLPVTMTGSD